MSGMMLAYGSQGNVYMVPDEKKQSDKSVHLLPQAAFFRDVFASHTRRKSIFILIVFLFISSLAYSLRLNMQGGKAVQVPLPDTSTDKTFVQTKPVVRKGVSGKNERTSATTASRVAGGQKSVTKTRGAGKNKTFAKMSAGTGNDQTTSAKSTSVTEKNQSRAVKHKENRTVELTGNREPEKNTRMKHNPAGNTNSGIVLDRTEAEQSVTQMILLAENQVAEQFTRQILRQKNMEKDNPDSGKNDQKEEMLEVISGNSVIEIPAGQFINEISDPVVPEQAVSEEAQTGQQFPFITIKETETGSVSTRETLEQKQVAMPVPLDERQHAPVKQSKQVNRKITEEKSVETREHKTVINDTAVKGSGQITEKQESIVLPAPGTVVSRYVKLDHQGEQLEISETEWACVKDGANDLVWENKTDNGGLQDKNHSYSWYQSQLDPDDSIGVATSGEVNGGRCKGGIACDTQSYIDKLNSEKLCGYSDWRLPTRDELLTLVQFHDNKTLASIDLEFFPHSVPSWYWTATDNEDRNEYAWYVLFRNGVPLSDLKKRPKHVRLVRTVGKIVAQKESVQE